MSDPTDAYWNHDSKCKCVECEYYNEYLKDLYRWESSPDWIEGELY